MKYLLAFILFQLAWAGSVKKNFSYSSFEEAKKANTSLKFIVESTKAGMFSSDIDGYIKSFSYEVNYDENNQILRNMKISLDTKSMDTDHEGRDEKLHKKVMEAQKFPELIVEVKGPLFLKAQREETYKGIAYIRGKKKEFEVTMKGTATKKGFIVEGNSSWSLKGMEIPDPSIFIAKLSDEIRLRVKINHNEK
jgi:polyisoprenoid-binding protein YceI